MIDLFTEEVGSNGRCSLFNPDSSARYEPLLIHIHYNLISMHTHLCQLESLQYFNSHISQTPTQTVLVSC